MQAYEEVTKAEADAYQAMKTDLGFANDAEILNYIRVKAINSFNPKNLITSVQK
jgi:hypothetical protein